MEYFDKKGITYVKHDLAAKESRDLRKTFREAGFTVLPVIYHITKQGDMDVVKAYMGFNENDMEKVIEYERKRMEC